MHRTLLSRLSVGRDFVLFYHRLTFLVGFDVRLHNIRSDFLLNGGSHGVEHLKALKLIFTQRIGTAVST
ncbi:hypothetical protein D3C81_2190690 [compost metagenome]